MRLTTFDMLPARARRLDAFLDALATGKESGDSVDPGLEGTVRRLHAASAETAALPRQRSMPMPFPHPIRSSSKPVPRLIAPPSPRRRIALSDLVSAGFLVAILLSGYFAFAAGRPVGQREDDPSVVLYRTDVFLSGQQLVALDPVTLADAPDGGPLKLATPSPPASPVPARLETPRPLWFSCTGSPRVIRIDRVDEHNLLDVDPRTYAIHDAESGEELSRIDVEAQASPIAVSRDCRRLVAWRSGYPPLIASDWYVYDLQTGSLLSSYSNDRVGQGHGLNEPGVVDHLAGRLYILMPDGVDPAAPDPSLRPPGPYPTALLIVDLAAGRELGQIPLPSVLAGTWSEEHPQFGAVGHTQRPAVAVSPNTGMVAVVTPDASAVTLIDARALTIERQIPLPQAAASPNAPAPVSAIDLDAGVTNWRARSISAVAAFAADDQALFIVSYESVLSADYANLSIGQPLFRVDLASGQVEADADVVAWQLAPSPDGRTVYAVGPRWGISIDPDLPVFHVRRLDATTLAVEAERTLPEGWYAMILPIFR